MQIAVAQMTKGNDAGAGKRRRDTRGRRLGKRRHRRHRNGDIMMDPRAFAALGFGQVFAQRP